MKLSETTFFVRVNKNFVQKLRLKPPQLFWFIIQAAKSLDTDLWDSNEANKATMDFDCWNHNVGVEFTGPNHQKTELYTIEAIPYPKGVLMLGVRDHMETYPFPENGEFLEMFYPDNFREQLNMTEEQLLIERAIIGDGQNKFRR